MSGWRLLGVTCIQMRVAAMLRALPVRVSFVFCGSACNSRREYEFGCEDWFRTKRRWDWGATFTFDVRSAWPPRITLPMASRGL